MKNPQENHATVKVDSSIAPRESIVELRNLQVYKEILEKSSQFLSSEQLCEPKSLDAAFNIAEVEKVRWEKLQLR